MGKWVETFKGAVLVSEYDSAAHMNSQIYVSRFDQATWFLMQTIGITPSTMKRQGRRVAIVRQTYQFLAELRGGELVVIKSGFVGIGKKYIRFIHQMVNFETGKLVATSDCTAVQASLKEGKSVPLPVSIKTSAKAHQITSDLPQPELERTSR